MTPPVGAAVSSAAGQATAAEAGLPWPKGDADGLADAAHQASSAAHLLRSTGGRLTSAASSASSWHGAGAQAFQTAAHQEHAGMVKAAGGLEHAAGALKRLSREVQDAQELVAKLAQQVIDAEEEARRAAARAALAEIDSLAAAARVTFAGAHPSESLTTAADDAAGEASSAAGAAGDAQAHAQAVRERNTRKAQEACDNVEREDAATAGAVNAATAAAPLAGIRAGQPTPATRFAQRTLGDLTVDQWRAIAYYRAHIDGRAWDPSKGLWANDATVQKVYLYYGNLFLGDNDLQWAGMANLVGPMFYGGWQDLHAIRKFIDREGDDGFNLLEAVLPALPGGVLSAMPGPLRDLVGEGRDISSGELKWFENQFLTMQKSIFDDLAWQHEAFTMGGAALVHEVARDSPGQLDPRTLQAWDDIGSGRPDRVAAGNEQLLRREQQQVIQPYYDQMRDYHGIVGDSATYAFSVMADNPIPGGHSYHDYDPLTVHIDVDTPDIPVGPAGPFGPHIDIGTPDLHESIHVPYLPAGNLSNFDDRWSWIKHDMLPAYQHLLHQPGGAQAIVTQPVADRAADYRHFPDFHYGGE